MLVFSDHSWKKHKPDMSASVLIFTYRNCTDFLNAGIEVKSCTGFYLIISHSSRGNHPHRYVAINGSSCTCFASTTPNSSMLEGSHLSLIYIYLLQNISYRKKLRVVSKTISQPMLLTGFRRWSYLVCNFRIV